MKRILSGLIAALCVAASVSAGDVAVVTKDRVNVRGQASVKSEVIIQLKKGEAVNILEEVTSKPAKKGQPEKWYRIQLPAGTPVWVYSPYVDAADKTIRVNRVNLRGGPGEQYSILGRITRGTVVKELRLDNNWMEIEAPTNTFAFVAVDLVERAPAATVAEPPAQVAQVPPPDTKSVADPAAPVVPVDNATPPPVVAPAATNAAPVVVQVEPPRDEPAPRRIVTREGRVIFSRSIQAPTTYAIEHLGNYRTINYLHSEDSEINLKHFAGKKVFVTGEELIDKRWPGTPIIEVESIQLAP